MYQLFLWLVNTVLNFLKQTYKWIYILSKTLPRDIRMFIILIKVALYMRKCKKQNATIAKIFAERVKKHPKKVALYFEDEAWTFEKVEKFSNKIANYFKQQGYKKGDTVAILLENCIQYLPIWLGLSKSGILAALVNANLVKNPLVHSLETANCKGVIFGTNHAKVVQEVQSKLKFKKLYQLRVCPDEEYDDSMGSVDLLKELDSCSDTTDLLSNQSISDKLMYIYTSGTTGLPKAALITQLKYITGCKSFKEITEITENDVYYMPLPLYHSAGSVGIGLSLITGTTVVARKKFSARNYFSDCAKHNVTVAQYIGELCRYLLAVPENQCVKHQLKAMIGNGLKPQIWKKFAARFKIQRIIEVYGSTEGTTFLINIDGTVGSIGSIPRYIKWAIGVTIIKCDEATGEPLRNKKGFCEESDVGDAGILIGKIDPKTSLIAFDGYTDKKASEKKLLRNVFRTGDLYFNSGDILEYDEFGNYYFKDRTGDTFRWKGENVSTSEIEAVISNIVNLNDVVVYGVKIPNSDGRAGMAALVNKEKSINVDTLAHEFKQNLPKYAVPIFLRMVNSIPMTGSFKLKKVDLKEEGYNINKIKDNIYFYHPIYAKYVPLTADIYEQIENGSLKL